MTVPNNLPVHLTSFIGREPELAEVARLARQHRLVTLAGSGGAGKTRLALHVAAELGPARRDGVWWVELAPISDPAMVTEALLGVLRVADAPGRSALQRLLAHLGTRDLLLVLDNCEHVLDVCADVIEAVLRACPDVSVLTTSRESLSVPGEVTWQIPPLTLPARDAPIPVASLGSYDAVRLFVDRALRARPNFAVTNDSAPAIAEICARLDGIPLAIELAAARTRVLTPRQILAGLEDRFRLLTGGARSALARQQTLHASVAWSHDLLTAEEAILFRRLAVFAGGFILDAAETVGAETVGATRLERPAVLDLLDGLVGKSLVQVVDAPDGAFSRYRLLETIRDFAALALARAEETAPARDAHLKFCLESARQAEVALVSVSPTVIRRLAPEQDNYRAALDWALAGGEAGPALELARPHAFLLGQRGRFREAHDALVRALDLPDASPVARADALWMLGMAQWFLGDLAGLDASATEMLGLARSAGNRRLEARAEDLSCWLLLFSDPEAAKARLAVALPMAEEACDAWVLMDILCELLFIAVRADDTAEAAHRFDRSQALAEAYDNDCFRAWNLFNEAFVAGRVGSLSQARSAAQRAIALSAALGDAAVTAIGTGVLAEVELLAGSPERALAVAEPAIHACLAAAAHIAMPRLLTVQAQAGLVLGDAGARAALESAVEVAGQVGDPWQHAPAALAWARLLIGAGDHEAAESVVAAARHSGEQLGSPWVRAAADHAAGLLAAARGEPDRAERLHHTALAVHAKHGFALGVIDSLEALAALAAAQESWAEAVRLLAATDRRRDELGYRHDRDLVTPTESAARAGLGDEAFDAAWAEGEALTIEAAVAYTSRARGERKRPSAGWGSLTPTELDVSRLAAQGLTNAEIGERLFIAVGTTKIHLSHIYAKLGLANRAQLTAELTRRER